MAEHRRLRSKSPILVYCYYRMNAMQVDATMAPSASRMNTLVHRLPHGYIAADVGLDGVASTVVGHGVG